MSRIDEAMKRVSQGSHPGRGPARGTEVSLRLAEDFTLNEYPPEGRGAARLEVAITHESPIPQEARISSAPFQSGKLRVRTFVDKELDRKLVVGSTRDVVSTEQYPSTGRYTS